MNDREFIEDLNESVLSLRDMSELEIQQMHKSWFEYLSTLFGTN